MKQRFRQFFIAALYFGILILLAANLFVVYNEVEGRHFSFAWRFYFDRRLNFPFFFSISLLIINLFLLLKIASAKALSKAQSFFWKTLFITFLLFAIDEAFYIHQHFKMSTFGTIASYDPKSWTHYLWIIPYFIVFGVLLAVLYFKSSSINTQLAKNLLVAGFIFLIGAVGMEFAGTFYAVIRPRADVYLLLIKTIEAGLQMIGSVMFIDTFLRMKESLKQSF